MASVFQRGSRWYVRVKDSTGRWINRVTVATTKTEARRLAGDVERKAERVRFGLEAAPPVDGGGTLGDLLTWWLDTYRRGQPAYATEASGVRVHIQASALASLPLVQITAGQIEELLQRKAGDGLSAESLNHLRGYIGRAFSKARKAGRWHGTNPVLDVDRRRVNRKTPDYLRPDEVRGVLDNLPERWRPAFAVAIYCGLRFGEVAGLRKTDVDFGEDTHLTVRRSWARDTTKGGRARVVPVPAECIPFLRAAVAASPSDLLFPGEGGKMLGRGKRLTPMLRRRWPAPDSSPDTSTSAADPGASTPRPHPTVPCAAARHTLHGCGRSRRCGPSSSRPPGRPAPACSSSWGRPRRRWRPCSDTPT